MTVDDSEFNVIVSGDSGSDYSIRIKINNSRLYINCSCPAGKNMMRCKHSLAILNKDFSRVKDENERKLIFNVFSSLKINSIDDKAEKELLDLECLEKEIKEKKKNIKKLLDDLFFKGVSIG